MHQLVRGSLVGTEAQADGVMASHDAEKVAGG